MRRVLVRLTVLFLALGMAICFNPGLALAATVTITISPGSGTVGSTVTVTSSAFAATESVQITYDTTNVVVPAFNPDTTGHFSKTFTVPASASGVGVSHTITAFSSTNTGSATFTVTPAISVTPTGGSSGSSVTVTGTGFAAGEMGIVVTFDGTLVSTVPASPTADATTGGWTATFSTPASASGTHTIGARGAITTTITTTTFTVTPVISINPTSGSSGSSVTVSGTGFAASETGITVTYDGNTVSSGNSANTIGVWSATFAVPASASGSHTIDAYGSTTLAADVTNLGFTVGSGISINRTSGMPGSSIAVTGAGFAAGETGITIIYDGNTVASGISASASGGWSTTFTVPTSASGAHAIDARGAITLATTVADVVFTVTPIIFISATGGSSGSSVTVSGAGFAASETGITVTYDGNAVASGTSASTLGVWSATFVVPASAAGSHSIKTYGSLTPTTSVSEVSFSITPSLSISPISGNVGTTIDITGSGFAANSAIRFIYDDKEISLGGAITDASGSFSKSIAAPKCQGGTHNIKIMDAQKNESRATFVMESIPPAAPRPLSPGDGERVGILGDIRPTFKWSVVTDPSGVTCTLQVDTNPDFSQPILEKADLPGTQYILTAADALPQGEYYWRIKAVDGASNESAWSPPQLLKSGLMPLSTLFIIISLVVVVAGVLVYLLVIRTRVKRKEAVAVAGAPASDVVAAQWRFVEPEEADKEAAKERSLPWRLALPEPTKSTKAFSTEDQARLRIILNFAQSLPLVAPDNNVEWLVDLVENSMGAAASAPVYEQLVKGELQVRYEPAWMRHPLYQDLTTLLEGQSLLQDLNAFVDAVSRCAAEAVSFLQDIYRDTQGEIPPDFFQKGGWGFISTIYSDSIGWLLGKCLREPMERDYTIKPGEGTEGLMLWLSGGGSGTGSPLLHVADEKEAAQLQALHLKVRRANRSSSKAREVMDMVTQLEVQRSELLRVLSQFGHLRQ